MSGTLPTWMERWFGLANRPGMGTAWRLENHWPWPVWATLLLAAVLLALVVHIYLRENRRTSRRFRLMLAALRLCQIALVLLMVAQIELVLQRTGLPYVVVIIDDTRSMNTRDSYDGELRKSLEARVALALPSNIPLTRWNLARTLFAENDGAMLNTLTDDHKLRFYFLSDFRESKHSDAPGIVEELKSTEAKGNTTRLGTAIRFALDDLRGTTPVAAVLATDGINTEGPGLLDAADYARRKGVPLFFVGIGSSHLARDLQLSDLEVEDVVFVNDLVHFRFKLTANGYEGKTLKIVLKREIPAGGSAEAKSEIVGHVEATVAADGRPQQVVLPYRPAQPGQFRFTIEVEPDAGSGTHDSGLGRKPGEESSQSGTASAPPDDGTAHRPLARSVRVREEKIRVLLVDGSPRFEYRFLHNMLGRDQTVELHTLLQEADMEFGDAEKSKFLKVFPVQPKDLAAYDVVIFGDVNPSLLSAAALQNLADYVDHSDKGGALVLIAGPNFMPQAYAKTPLARLLPFDPATIRDPEPNKLLSEGFVVQPTELGLVNSAMQLGDSPEQSQAIWQKLAPLYWMVEVSDLKPGARVLAEHPSRTGPEGKRLPLIILQYVGGGGRVLFHATDETYRWRRRVGDVYFARYWVQMLRFLTRSKLAEGDRTVRLSTDRQEYHLGDSVRIQAHFADDRVAPLDDNGVTVELEQTGRQTEKVQLHRTDAGRGQFETVLPNLPSGGYHAKIVTPALPTGVPATDFRIVPPQAEVANVQMDATEMKQAAELTHGKYYAFQDASRLPEDLPGGRQVPVENLPAVPLWNRWPVLLLFLVLLIMEWLLRKRGGMV